MSRSGELQNIVAIHPTRKEDLGKGEIEGKCDLSYSRCLVLCITSKLTNTLGGSRYEGLDA